MNKLIEYKIETKIIDNFFNEIFYENYDNLYFSYLFKVQCFLLNTKNQFSDFEYRVAVKNIAEGKKNNTGVRNDSQFTKEPLKGFWKKHIFLSENIPMNIASEIINKNSTTSKQMDKLFHEHNGEYIENIIDELSHLVVIGAFQNRTSESRTTGEWLVYAEVEKNRYILTMAKHKEGKNQRETDAKIFNRISRICFDEFPEIKKS